MKKIFHSLLMVCALTVNALAATYPVHRRMMKLPKMTKPRAQQDAELSRRSLQLTCYLVDMLRLTGKQAAEVRRATLLELQQGGPASKQAIATYNAALWRVLTFGQYSTFRWLEERQPVSNMLQNPFADESARR
ncbi:hypothetical protein [Hymenobacter rigui]|uniref:Uncharacterized protein n=1 Tax=Hymenobacter rigui TaxID=334424 RepID=A0A3R9P3F5_9BACT|nr:hypothetical protein [Hymenobacter rigui]RSK49303.1 hypothetical protein EI291_07335 [Hymenobacter rigui]